MDESDRNFFIMMLLAIILFVIYPVVVCVIPYVMGLDDERITVEGKIVDVDIKKEQRWTIRWDIVTLTFDNGQKYSIKYEIGSDYVLLTDFTVNSKFVFEFFRPDKGSDWVIEKFYKIPS